MSDVSSEYSDDDDERERALIREEWEDSLRQMQMLFSIVLVPFFGKWMGRRWSYWGEFVRRHHITNTGAEKMTIRAQPTRGTIKWDSEGSFWA